LDHKDDIVRYNAAMSLAFEFHHSASGEKLLKMLETDLDEDCRDVAAGAMGTLFENTRNGRIMTSLAKAALNDPDEYVRRSAYRALRVVNGISREQRLEMLGSEDLSVDPVEIKAILQEAFG
jgi:HEAT repeat protein